MRVLALLCVMLASTGAQLTRQEWEQQQRALLQRQQEQQAQSEPQTQPRTQQQTAVQQDPAQAVPPAIQKLRSPITNIALKDIFRQMNDPDAVEFYVNCVTEEGRCDSIGRALRHLVLDERGRRKMCYGCTKCERERVQYVMDTLKTNYKTLSCKIQNYLQRPVFGSINICI